MKTKFGGGRSTGFALIYDNKDARAKYDSKCNLLRDKLITKRKVTRKALKEIKGRKRKVKGTKKSKVQSGGKKR